MSNITTETINHTIPKQLSEHKTFNIEENEVECKCNVFKTVDLINT